MNCSLCSAKISTANVNLDKLVAKCDACGQVFSFRPEDLPKAKAKPAASTVPRPESLKVAEGMEGKRITYRWFGVVYVFLIFFCFAWNSFLFGWYSKLFSKPEAFDLLAFLFPLVHLGVGIFLSYLALAGLLNTTVFEVQNGALQVRHRPMPWYPNPVIPVAAIQQIYVEEQVKYTRNRQSQKYYMLYAILKDRSRVKLFQSTEQAEAVFLEWQLESWLRIVDERVPGEMPKQR